jgi:predicted nucleotidyltransferase
MSIYYAGGMARTEPSVRLLEDRRDEVIETAARHGARNVRVFGSVARGDARPDSDIDLLVEFAPGSSLLDHAALVRALAELLGRRVEVASDRGLRASVRERVLREAVAL